MGGRKGMGEEQVFARPTQATNPPTHPPAHRPSNQATTLLTVGWLVGSFYLNYGHGTSPFLVD